MDRTCFRVARIDSARVSIIHVECPTGVAVTSAITELGAIADIAVVASAAHSWRVVPHAERRVAIVNGAWVCVVGFDLLTALTHSARVTGASAMA
jgi:hypothetical protein